MNKCRKKVECLVLLGSLESLNDSSWGLPYFPQTKNKTNRVDFKSEFVNLNKQLKLEIERF